MPLKKFFRNIGLFFATILLFVYIAGVFLLLETNRILGFIVKIPSKIFKNG